MLRIRKNQGGDLRHPLDIQKAKMWGGAMMIMLVVAVMTVEGETFNIDMPETVNNDLVRLGR